MIGLIFWTIIGICLPFYFINRHTEQYKDFIEFAKEDEPYYVDSRGNYRLCSNGEKCIIVPENGDDCLYSIDGKIFILNIREFKEKIAHQKSIEDCKKQEMEMMDIRRKYHDKNILYYPVCKLNSDFRKDGDIDQPEYIQYYTEDLTRDEVRLFLKASYQYKYYYGYSISNYIFKINCRNQIKYYILIGYFREDIRDNYILILDRNTQKIKKIKYEQEIYGMSFYDLYLNHMKVLYDELEEEERGKKYEDVFE